VYTRRRVLASTAGVGAVAFLGRYQARQGAAPPSATLQVDFAETAFFPLLKSKIGVGRALDSTEILDSLAFLDDIRPALYDAELRFPDTGWPSLTPYPIEVGKDGTVQVQKNAFLDTLFAGHALRLAPFGRALSFLRLRPDDGARARPRAALHARGGRPV